MITIKSNGRYSIDDMEFIRKVLTKGYNNLTCPVTCESCTHKKACKDILSAITHLSLEIEKKHFSENSGE